MDKVCKFIKFFKTIDKYLWNFKAIQKMRFFSPFISFDLKLYDWN